MKRQITITDVLLLAVILFLVWNRASPPTINTDTQRSDSVIAVLETKYDSLVQQDSLRVVELKKTYHEKDSMELIYLRKVAGVSKVKQKYAQIYNHIDSLPPDSHYLHVSNRLQQIYTNGKR